MRKISLVMLILFVISSVHLFAKENSDLPVLDMKVKTLAAFKNGLAFVYRSAKTELVDGSAVINEIPSALLGTMWIGTPNDGMSVDRFTAFKNSVPGDMDIIDLGELLEANIGKSAVILWQIGSGGEIQKTAGIISSVPKLYRSANPTDRNLYNQARIVIMKTADGKTVSINKALIQSVEMSSGTELNTKAYRDVTGAKVHVSGNSKSANIDMAYLTKGITWSPSYLIDIKNDKEAQITLEAILANDVEDIDNAEVSFVVGYPNFKYSDILSPINAQQSVSDFIKSLIDQSSASSRGQSNIMTQSIMYNMASYDQMPGMPPPTWDPGSYDVSNISGESSEDLFFYKQQNVTLKKGERARFSVFNIKSPYAHLYKWDIKDSMNIDDWGSRIGSSPSQNAEEQVWHMLKLNNTSKLPWTTAPAFVIKGSMPISQDVLNYTAAGGKGEIKLTVATDVKAEQSQIELARESKKIDSSFYDEITVGGTLSVKNYKSESITMNVKKALTGEVVIADSDGKITKVAKRLSAINSQSEISWDFSIKAGEEKKLTYKYRLLMRK